LVEKGEAKFWFRVPVLAAEGVLAFKLQVPMRQRGKKFSAN